MNGDAMMRAASVVPSARTASIALVPDDPPTRRPSIFLRRFQRLPLVLTPA